MCYKARVRPAFAVLLASFTVPVTAAAQNTSWHATASGDVAVTDNVFAAPSEEGFDRDGDLFFQLRPGLIFTYNSPRMIHDLSAELEVLQYALNSRVPSVQFRAGWRGFWLPGPRSEVITSVNGGTGILSALGSRLTPDETMVNVQPVGKVTVKSADASAYASYTATRELRLSQTLFARWSETDDNVDEISTDPLAEATITKSADAGIGLGIERAFRSNALSLELGGSVQRFERIAPMNAGPGLGSRQDQQLSPRARAQWRHDINRRLSLSVDGGLVFVIPFGTDPYNPDDDRKSGMFPIVGGAFSVIEAWGRATMSLRRDVTPNLYVAQNTVNDQATIAVAMPLPWLDNSRRRQPRLVGLGSIGITRTQLIDSVTSEAQSTIGAARVDLGAAYTPKPGFTYSLRYELQYQTGDDNAVGMPIKGFWRNTVYFSFNIRYPDRMAGAVPKRRAGNAVRADRKDLVPMGAEPVIPDIIEGEGDGEGGDER